MPNHYATLGLERDCTLAEVREAYRRLVKEHHPDRHAQAPEAVRRAQELNAAHEVLSDPTRRRVYDREQGGGRTPRAGRISHDLAQDVNLRLEDFFRGTALTVTVRDPLSREPETYPVEIPPMTAPGTRLRLARNSGEGHLRLRLRAMPSARFKPRGSDLRCDLRIDARRAAAGGSETITGADGRRLTVRIPAQAGRGEMVRLPNEGLPRARGGRGDLLVKITYRVEVQVRRAR